MIESPCIGVCKIVKGTNTCKGCLRTVEEISKWSSMSDKDKALTLVAIEYRRILNPHD